MREVYSHCATAARDGGQKRKEAKYKKKSLEAAGAISKIYVRIQVEQNEEDEREEAEMKRIMRSLAKLSH